MISPSIRFVTLGSLLSLAACGSREPQNEVTDDGTSSDSGLIAQTGGRAGAGGHAGAGAGGASGALGGGGAKSDAAAGGKATGGAIDGSSANGGGGADGGSSGSAGTGGADGGDAAMVLDCSSPGHPSPIVKIACVGDSITQGAGASASMSYPSQLGVLLGSGYAVGNFGVSSTDMLKNGDYSYWTHGKLSEAEAFSPNDVVIALGTNDIGTGAWGHKSELVDDYSSMIGVFKNLASHPSVFAVLPPWLKDDNTYTGYTEARMAEAIPLIIQAAQQRGACVIDLHSLTKNHPEYYSDGIHPNDAGYGVIAQEVCGAVLGGCPAR
jgi:lysophospholipase L1-like esterase